MSNNMKLWNSVCETNPEITKRVNQRGGFTAIDSQTQVKKATELWGPYGYDWGLIELKFNEFKEGDKIIGLMAFGMFQYPVTELNDDGTCTIAKFPIAADMPYKPNDDCVKKLMTECISKALSRLGFNSDVFEGKFDDNRYVSEMKKKYEQRLGFSGEWQEKDLEIDITKAKVAEPYGGAAAMVLDMIRDKLMSYCDDNKFIGTVDMKLLEAAIMGEYGKLPVKESSVTMVAEKMWELCKADASLIFVDDTIKGI